MGGNPIAIFAFKTCNDIQNNLVKVDTIPKLSAITLNLDK